MDDLEMGPSGAAGSPSEARREGERKAGDCRPAGEPARYATHAEVIERRGALVAEEGRARHRVQRDAVSEERREATKFSRVWKEIRGRDEAVRTEGAGLAAEDTRALYRIAAFFGRR